MNLFPSPTQTLLEDSESQPEQPLPDDRARVREAVDELISDAALYTIFHESDEKSPRLVEHPIVRFSYD